MFVSGFLQVLQFYVKIWSKKRKPLTPLPDAPASRDSDSWETKEAHIPTADFSGCEQYRRRKKGFSRASILFPIRLQCFWLCDFSVCLQSWSIKGEWSHFNLAAVSPVNPKAQLLGPIIWYSWWLTAKCSPTGIIFHRILQGHRKLREAFAWSHSHLLHTAGWKYFLIKKKMEEWEWLTHIQVHLYRYTLGLPPLKCQSEQPIIILSVGLLSTYLTEFWEPVPSHLPFESGLACDWRLD